MFKIIMFISSLLPMYICLFIKYSDYKTVPTSFTISIILILIGLACTVYILHYTKDKRRGKYYNISNIAPMRELSLNYLMAYVLPLIVFEFDKLSDIAIFFIMYGLIMILYIKYNLIYFNLTLELLGFIVCKADISSIEGQEKQVLIILKNRKHIKQNSLKLDLIGDGLYFNINRVK